MSSTAAAKVARQPHHIDRRHEASMDQVIHHVEGLAVNRQFGSRGELIEKHILFRSLVTIMRVNGMILFFFIKMRICIKRTSFPKLSNETEAYQA